MGTINLRSFCHISVLAERIIYLHGPIKVSDCDYLQVGWSHLNDNTLNGHYQFVSTAVALR